jgi:hypothetical protein
MLRLPFAQQGLLLQVRERSGVLLALALAGLVLTRLRTAFSGKSLANGGSGLSGHARGRVLDPA